jgi:hypothetical protein
VLSGSCSRMSLEAERLIACGACFYDNVTSPLLRYGALAVSMRWLPAHNARKADLTPSWSTSRGMRPGSRRLIFAPLQGRIDQNGRLETDRLDKTQKCQRNDGSSCLSTRYARVASLTKGMVNVGERLRAKNSRHSPMQQLIVDIRPLQCYTARVCLQM